MPTQSLDAPAPPHAAADAATDTDTLLLYNILRTHGSLAPYLDRELRDLNLTSAQLNTLLALREAGTEGLPLGEIGRRLVVTKANVAGLIDRLEREGLVERAGSTDRRVTLAQLTERGAAVLEAALPRHRQLLSRLLECLTTEEKQQLIGLLTRLRRGLRENTTVGETMDAGEGAQ